MTRPCVRCCASGGRYVPRDPDFDYWHGLGPNLCGTGMRMPTAADGPWVPCKDCDGGGVVEALSPLDAVNKVFHEELDT